jgi:hypothetical protein
MNIRIWEMDKWEPVYVTLTLAKNAIKEEIYYLALWLALEAIHNSVQSIIGDRDNGGVWGVVYRELDDELRF